MGHKRSEESLKHGQSLSKLPHQQLRAIRPLMQCPRLACCCAHSARFQCPIHVSLLMPSLRFRHRRCQAQSPVQQGLRIDDAASPSPDSCWHTCNACRKGIALGIQLCMDLSFQMNCITHGMCLPDCCHNWSNGKEPSINPVL